MKHVCVIGAGIVGAATAYQLARRGLDVTVVDAADAPAQGTTWGNGGQLSYQYVQPLASPATLAALPGMLLDRHSPLRWNPWATRDGWLWMLRFLWQCRAASSLQSAQALWQLARLSRQTLDRWMADGLTVSTWRRNGKLVLCPNPASLDAQRQAVQWLARWGGQQEMADRERCLEIEPTLAHYGHAFVGGVWTPDDCAVDPRDLTLSLLSAAQALGARTVLGAQADRWVVEAGCARALRGADGDIEADAFVIAAGLGAVPLARQAGVRLALQPVKGYSLTLPVCKPQAAPRVSVTDLGAKTVCAQLGSQLRVAAMAELVGPDLRLRPQRIQQMLDWTARAFPDAAHLEQAQAWAGLRPTPPDSVPVIGRSRLRNVFINAGHGALGLTLAAGSAAVLDDLMAGRPVPAESARELASAVRV